MVGKLTVMTVRGRLMDGRRVRAFTGAIDRAFGLMRGRLKQVPYILCVFLDHYGKYYTLFLVFHPRLMRKIVFCRNDFLFQLFVIIV